MIQSFRHKGLEKFFKTGSKAGIQPKHARVLEEQLGALNASNQPADMNFPGWGFHQLKGILGLYARCRTWACNLQGHYAVWVNANWRLTFAFDGTDAILVDYEGYH